MIRFTWHFWLSQLGYVRALNISYEQFNYNYTLNIHRKKPPWNLETLKVSLPSNKLVSGGKMTPQR